MIKYHPLGEKEKGNRSKKLVHQEETTETSVKEQPEVIYSLLVCLSSFANQWHRIIFIHTHGMFTDAEVFEPGRYTLIIVHLQRTFRCFGQNAGGLCSYWSPALQIFLTRVCCVLSFRCAPRPGEGILWKTKIRKLGVSQWVWGHWRLLSTRQKMRCVRLFFIRFILDRGCWITFNFFLLFCLRRVIMKKIVRNFCIQNL